MDINIRSPDLIVKDIDHLASININVTFWVLIQRKILACVLRIVGAQPVYPVCLCL